MTRKIEDLLRSLDDEWLRITPDAVQIRAQLEARGEHLVNDHVAFRTFDDPRVNLATLATPFVRAGYTSSGTYNFETKMLRAESFRPPNLDSALALPHVFISELDSTRISARLKCDVETVLSTLPDLDADAEKRAWSFLRREVEWSAPAVDVYDRLHGESEYASWLAAFGIRANHFTVAVHDLTTFDHVEDVNAWLVSEGYSLNGAAPFVQGSARALLAQSSTVAKSIPWKFAGGIEREIPSCYIEFAERFLNPATATVFDGFVTTSADKIFESTFGPGAGRAE